ncbi:glycoside hydrolase family 3 N-terminal domain-containing protein [Fodinicola acaciae]|uniref:beta-xylosidase/alpha-l-arabinosidase n=1 Tax=Fodinicola acaciae TaxID=2681555 RepID=UPI001FEB1EDA|nr:glycoside hydrolase family 3 N-terminal domain-containing protein [Fodinicola acaciae]
MENSAEPWRDPALPVDERVTALMAEMSLEDKVGQLGSAWLGQRAAGEVSPMQDALPDSLPEHGLGHLTRPFGTAPIGHQDGIERLAELQRKVIAANRFGIPAIAHEECLTGFATLGATVYPASIAWAATFDPELVGRMAAAIGADLRAVGVHQGLSPLLDVVRDYRWGRVEETLGEDPYLVATLGTAYVRGLQSAGVVATLKHFAGYPASRAGRNHAPVSVGPREFSEVLLWPFEMAVRDGGARSVMNSYSDVDGLPAAANEQLLTGILRDDWGFDGVVVSDYFAVTFLQTTHRVAASRAEAAALAIDAGIDVELPSTHCYGELVALVRSGQLPEKLVDRAARRVLTQKVELGLLDPGWTPAAGVATLDSPANRTIAAEMAEKSVILLANTGVLPLEASSIALVGPCGDDPLAFMGCYSFPNHVLPHYPGVASEVAAPSLLASLRNEIPSSVVSFHEGCPIRDPDRGGISTAVEAARAADVCVAAVGDRAGLFGLGTSGEGCDAADLSLPGVQSELLEALLATGTPVVIVVVSGRPYALGDYADRAAAIVQAFMPGEEGGPAIAGVLSGRVNPSGRLPVQVPRITGGQPGTYLHPPLGGDSAGISNLDPSPLFPFGHGISYTTYAYSGLRLEPAEIPVDGTFAVSVTVTNTGSRNGAETVQLYLRDLYAQVTRPVRQLTGFCRVRLDPGEQAEVTFSVHADRTSFVGRDLRRIVEPGEVEVLVGSSSEMLPCVGKVRVVGAVRVIDGDYVRTTPVEVSRKGVG